jgi:outer membrane protein
MLIPAAALLCAAFSANAQQPAPKIGIVSMQGALAGTKDGQKANQELETKFSPKQKEFETRRNEIAQLQDQYNKGGTVMSDEKRNALAREIDEKKKRLDRDVQDANDEYTADQQRLLQNLGQRVLAVIDKYAKDNGYTLVLDDSNPSTPIVYAASATDITQDIISLYDKSSVNGGPAVPPPSTAGKPATPPAKPGPPGAKP